MKSKRTYGLLAVVLAFALIATAAQTGSLPKNNSNNQNCREPQQTQRPANCQMITTHKKTVNIFLHGLIVGRDKKDDPKRFEVGIVKRVPGHEFMFNVNVDGKIDMSSNCASKEIKRKGEWVFEVRSANGRPTARTIIMPPTTYGPILNIEENLHGSRLRRFKRPFKPVFYFHNGTVTTQCRTLNLCAQRVERKGRDERIGIGSIAEVIKISIVLELGQKLVLFQPGTNPERVIWENSYNGATEGDDSAEGRILNLSYDHKNEATMREAPYDCNCETYPSEVEEPEVPEDRPATDFQLYYSLVFKKDRADRFELINPSNECKTEMYLDHKSSVPPYKCGMMLVSSEEIKYEKAQE